MAQAERLQSRHRATVARDNASHDGAGARDAYLLANDRPHTRLERVPGAGGPDPCPRTQQRTDDRIVTEVSRHRFDVGVEAEDAPSALRDVNQALPVRQMGPQYEVVGAARDSSRTPGSPSTATVRR